MKIRLALVVLAGIAALGALAALTRRTTNAPTPAVQLRTGDIVFQSSHSRQAQWIEQATDSPFSHVGIVDMTEHGPEVIEAVEPVKRTPWKAWWERGRGHRVLVLRPRELTESQGRAVIKAADSFLGRHYDALFDWDDDRIYCSELVEKAFAQGAQLKLGHMERLGQLHIAGMEKPLHERFGSGIPVDREMITPASIAADSHLTRVWSSFP